MLYNNGAYVVPLLLDSLFWKVFTICYTKECVDYFCELLDVVILEWVINWEERTVVFFEQAIKRVVWGWDPSAWDFGNWLWLWINMMIESTLAHIEARGFIWWSLLFSSFVLKVINKEYERVISLLIIRTYLLQVGVFCGINHLRDYKSFVSSLSHIRDSCGVVW